MNNLSHDVSLITDIPKLTLDKLSEKQCLCLAHALYESILDKESTAELDVGFGKLYVKCEGDQVKYKFIPSKKLDNLIIQTIKYKKSPLITSAEDSIMAIINKVYEELR